MILEQLKQLHKDGKADSIILKNNTKLRLFIASGDYGGLCYYKKGSSRRGYQITSYHLEQIKEIKEKIIINPDDKNYKLVAKYRKQALKAGFINDFIRDCLSIPDSREKWEAEGKKDLYKYGITSGNWIEGQVITLKNILSKLRQEYQEMVIEAIKEKKDFSLSRFEFNGYDGSLQFTKKENGDFIGYFNKEFRGCGNGYYYLLINEDNFIGYDVD